jgi:hypothetical protein
MVPYTPNLYSLAHIPLNFITYTYLRPLSYTSYPLTIIFIPWEAKSLRQCHEDKWFCLEMWYNLVVIPYKYHTKNHLSSLSAKAPIWWLTFVPPTLILYPISSPHTPYSLTPTLTSSSGRSSNCTSPLSHTSYPLTIIFIPHPLPLTPTHYLYPIPLTP